MAIRKREPVPPTVVDRKGARVRVQHPTVPTMTRTVLGAKDPKGNRVTLKAGTPTPDWYTGSRDGRNPAPVAEAPATVHPSEQPMPEGEAWQVYLDDVFQVAEATGERTELEWPTQSALDAQERGLSYHAAAQELAALTDDERALLDALDADDRLELASLSDDQRDEMTALVEHLKAAEVAAQVEAEAEQALLAALDGMSPEDLAALQALAALPEGELEALLGEQPTEQAELTLGGEADDQAAAAAAADAALIEGSVAVVLDRVGTDQALVRRALAAEQAKGADARTTLTDELTKRAGG